MKSKLFVTAYQDYGDGIKHKYLKHFIIHNYKTPKKRYLTNTILNMGDNEQYNRAFLISGLKCTKSKSLYCDAYTIVMYNLKQFNRYINVLKLLTPNNTYEYNYNEFEDFFKLKK